MFFDLHVHPTLKAYLTNGKVNCWGYVTSGLLNSEFSSQSNLHQMYIGNVRIAVAALHAIEQAFCAPHLLKGLLPYFSPLDGNLLRQIESNKRSYFSVLKDEIDQFDSCKNVDGESFKFVNSFSEIDENKTNIILSVEGGHSFIKTKSKNFNEIGKDILHNFREFKKLPHRLLFITLTHLSQGVLCNHAFGMKMQLMFRDKRFYPKGSGLTKYGIEFIREALKIENGRRILIDVKHMSLRSRKEFYELRKKEFPDAPIVASHMGIAGCSIYHIPIHSVLYRNRFLFFTKGRERFKVKYYKQPGLLNTYFNPATINLYDEEIIEIIQSSGIIGISMDKRILGFGGGQKDLYSTEEYNNYYKEFIEKNRLIKTRRNVDITKEDEFDEEEQYGIYDKGPLDPRHQFRYVCNNIVHVVKVGGEKAWDCMCLGSDFDGMIDSLDSVPTIVNYNELENGLLEFLPDFIKEAGIPMPDVSKVVRKIMFENGYEFLRRNFK